MGRMFPWCTDLFIPVMHWWCFQGVSLPFPTSACWGRPEETGTQKKKYDSAWYEELPCEESLWSLPGRRCYVPLWHWQPQQWDGQPMCATRLQLPEASGLPLDLGCGQSRMDTPEGYSTTYDRDRDFSQYETDNLSLIFCNLSASENSLLETAPITFILLFLFYWS